MDINAEEYSLAISKLANTAQGDTGGARVAAQVLLSAYNGEAYQLNVVDLCNLDKDHYQAALSVIRGRKELDAEPQRFLKNGDQVLKELWKQWERYHVENRGKPTCNLCYGSGLIPEYPDDEDNYSQKTCTQCGGKGY
ncbi:hypothetical protein [Desulfopila sp. IMCC35006]|uniref:DUF7673 family protein n=1 Tax=Desulfopila sp. IMCC35006 TaxID=2569542 RepID=UPI00197AAA6C|nr:hypothetical protein [Desulfopila sp. IMCC35006]